MILFDLTFGYKNEYFIILSRPSYLPRHKRFYNERNELSLLLFANTSQNVRIALGHFNESISFPFPGTRHKEGGRVLPPLVSLGLSVPLLSPRDNQIQEGNLHTSSRWVHTLNKWLIKNTNPLHLKKNRKVGIINH